MFKKIIPILFFLILLFSTLLFIKTEITLAAPETFDPQVNIGVTDLNVDGGLMGRYIEGIYKYSIGFVGILAAVVLMFGGFLWITAAGNGERVANAKAWIQAALSGLVLALCSYTILWYVNPDLVKFESITVKEPIKGDEIKKPNVLGCCFFDGEQPLALEATLENCENSPTGDSGEWKGAFYQPDENNEYCVMIEANFELAPSH